MSPHSDPRSGMRPQGWQSSGEHVIDGTAYLRQMTDEQETIPILAAVIIARNEEEHIDRCISSVLAATTGFSTCDVVLIDSCSTDATVSIARSFPVQVAEIKKGTRCSPALGRSVGQHLTRSKYILFVDGDTEMVSGWVEEALKVLEARPEVAGVGGRVREVYYNNGKVVGESSNRYFASSELQEVEQLGGNALYRRCALEKVGSFNPFLMSYEETELAERLRQAGWVVVRIPCLLGAHRATAALGTFAELRRRLRQNLIMGYGQVLRLSIQQGLFWQHARLVKRYLQASGILLAGVLSVTLSFFLSSFLYISLWAMLCLVLSSALTARVRSPTKVLLLIVDWSVWALVSAVSFARTPDDPQGFDPYAVIAAHHRPPQDKVTARGLR